MTKIIQLNAENVKVLKAIEIKPDQNIVELTGKNGQGKSSIIDSIIMGILGKKYQPEKPVREGESEANISINIGNLIIKRKIKADGSSTLRVENTEGASYGSPQAMLDELVSNISFDPLQFSNMKAKEQFEQLKQVVKIDFNFAENESLKKGAYDERTIVNREIKELEAQAKNITYPADTPDKPIAIFDVLKEIEDAEAFNKEQDRLKGEKQRLEDRIAEMEGMIKELKKELENLPTPREHLLVEPLKELLKNSEQTNNNVALKEKKKEIEEKIINKQNIANDLTKEIARLDKLRSDAIQSCKMPVEGLSFGDGVVLFNGIPLEQCSQAEKIKISSSIAMSSDNNKQLKVVLIKDGSLLDEDNMKIITDMAEEKDYQVWIEKVDSSGKIGIVIEDGEIKAINKGE